MDYGRSPVPDDYTYATLIIGGEGRVIAPGLTALIDAPSYPIRLYKPTLLKRVEFCSSHSVAELLKFSIPAVYEAHLSGITTIILETCEPRLAAELADKAGGFYGVALPACVEEKPVPPNTVASLKIGGEGCQGEFDLEARGDWGYVGGERVLALFNRKSYILSGIEDAVELSNKLRSLMGLEPVGIRKGRRAELVVFDSSKPPAMLLHIKQDEVPRIYSSGARVESLIVGDDVIVDTYEHLRVAEKQLSESRKALLKLRGGEEKGLGVADRGPHHG